MLGRCFTWVVPMLAFAALLPAWGGNPDPATPGILLSESQATQVTGGQYTCVWTAVGNAVYCGGPYPGCSDPPLDCGTTTGPTEAISPGTEKLVDTTCSQRICGTDYITCGQAISVDCGF